MPKQTTRPKPKPKPLPQRLGRIHRPGRPVADILGPDGKPAARAVDVRITDFGDSSGSWATVEIGGSLLACLTAAADDRDRWGPDEMLAAWLQARSPRPDFSRPDAALPWRAERKALDAWRILIGDLALAVDLPASPVSHGRPVRRASPAAARGASE